MATRKSKSQKAKEEKLVAEETEVLTSDSAEQSVPSSDPETKELLRKGERITVHGITYRVRGTNPQMKEVLLRQVSPQETDSGLSVKIL